MYQYIINCKCGTKEMVVLLRVAKKRKRCFVCENNYKYKMAKKRKCS